MKARELQRLLNTTRICRDCDEYICVGSAYVHDLFKIDKATLEIKYALDTFREGRNALTKKDDTELLEIWDKLHELKENGVLKVIIEGHDVLENPLTVYTIDKGNVVETTTDKYGYPNVTFDGKLMHDNTYYKTELEAINYGIKEYGHGVKYASERVAEITEKDLKRAKEWLEREQTGLNNLVNLKKTKYENN